MRRINPSWQWSLMEIRDAPLFSTCRQKINAIHYSRDILTPPMRYSESTRLCICMYQGKKLLWTEVPTGYVPRDVVMAVRLRERSAEKAASWAIARQHKYGHQRDQWKARDLNIMIRRIKLVLDIGKVAQSQMLGRPVLACNKALVFTDHLIIRPRLSRCLFTDHHCWA
jgi:hypothetical protein